MTIEVVQQRLLDYHSQTILEQENALKEIVQEIALLALSRSGFFRVGAFQGGTCLRILYGLERFSEDLDFVLETPDKTFTWSHYLQTMVEDFTNYGFSLEVKNRQESDKIVKTAFLKADSQGGELIIKDFGTQKRLLRIKLEIDTNPPEGSHFEVKYLDFPLPYSVRAQDLPSLFAGKCHALLCRDYVKGRDWYDFIWYVSRQVTVNFNLLENAIAQAGPWKNKGTKITPTWLTEELNNKIQTIDWEEAQKDVARFLKPRETASLALWSQEFFLTRVEKLHQRLVNIL